MDTPFDVEILAIEDRQGRAGYVPTADETCRLIELRGRRRQFVANYERALRDERRAAQRSFWRTPTGYVRDISEGREW